MDSSGPKRFRIALILLAMLFRPIFSEAKVTFTGYGDLQMTTHSRAKIYGDDAALAAFSLPEQAVESRGFSIPNVGLFATTNLIDNMDLLMDLTFHQLGQNVGQTTIQYVYLQHSPWDDFTYKAGKITLPFGYYNQNRFYSFQRIELSAPTFQSAILGLPISNFGAGAQKRIQLKSMRVDLDAYTVNGYGFTPSDKTGTKFRAATLVGGITIAGNVSTRNTNPNLAYGTRVNLAQIGGQPIDTGVSYFAGTWDKSGTKWYQLMNAYYHSDMGKLDLLVEYLHMDVTGDQGFVSSVNDTHYQTDGAFMTASYPLWQVRGMPLSPYIGAEAYVTRGHHSGGGQEKLQGYKGGLCLKPIDALRLKLEYAYLYYNLPLVGKGDLKIQAHTVALMLSTVF